MRTSPGRVVADTDRIEKRTKQERDLLKFPAMHQTNALMRAETAHDARPSAPSSLGESVATVMNREILFDPGGLWKLGSCNLRARLGGTETV